MKGGVGIIKEGESTEEKVHSEELSRFENWCGIKIDYFNYQKQTEKKKNISSHRRWPSL